MPEINPNNNPQDPEPIVTPNRPPEPKNSKTMLIVIVAAVVVIVGIVLAIVLSQGSDNDGNGGPGGTGQQDPDQLLASEPYVNEANGFSIEYPNGWVVADQPPEGVAAMISNSEDGQADGESEAALAIVKEETQRTLDEEVATALNRAPVRYAEFTLDNDEKVMLGDIPARVLTYSVEESDGSKQTLHQAIAVSDGFRYLVTARALTENWDTYKEAIEASVASFKLVE